MSRWLSLALALWPGVAQAAGLYLAPRGVRPLARAGAYVAGAEDAHALAYNPAGLLLDDLVIDVALGRHTTDYRRVVYADSAPEAVVQGKGLGLPSPTIGASHGFGLMEGLTFGMALLADYPLLQNWPTETEAGAPAPQRYGLLDYRGTLVSKLALGAAYSPVEWLRIGVGVQVFFGTFAATTTASNCDGAICTQPENPDYDATIQMVARDILAPGWQLGVIATPAPWLKLGLAYESGYTIDQEAELHVRLPSAPLYDDAYLDPAVPKGRVKLELPMTVRAGAELRDEALGRVELAFVWEPWSVHDVMRVETGGAMVRDLQALDDYAFGAVDVKRGFRDTWSLRLGGELFLGELVAQGLTARGGVAYEPSAVPPEYLTAMGVDLDKLIVGLGAAYQMDGWSLEATYAHVFMETVSVRDSRVLQVSATRPPWDGRTPIGNGDYAARADLFGIGMRLDL